MRYSANLLLTASLLIACILQKATSFSTSSPALNPISPLSLTENRILCSPLFATDDDDNNDNNNNNDNNEETKDDDQLDAAKSEQEAAADRWKQQAKELREQIEKMEAEMPEKPVDPERAAALKAAQEAAAAAAAPKEPVSLLDGKNILLVGSNGRLGSMVCRRLLREFPEIANVVAMVHVVGENSETSRGFGRLAYEVGAEDGRGSIGPAWSAEDRTATFEFDEEIMKPYHLEKLRIVECELLDPVQCKTIVDDANPDIIVWCATDFNGSTPRALSGGSGPLSGLPFLFRAVADPDKGRVEVEGLQNMLGALKTYKQEAIQRNRQLTAFGSSRFPEETIEEISETEKAKEDPTRGVDFLLVSSCPDALSNFETPFGAFWDIKRQGEDMIPQDFPSLKYSVLQFATYEDNFVKEDLELKLMEVVNEAPRILPEGQEPPPPKKAQKVRRINRRDAARAVGEALVDPDYHNKKIQVWTNEVG